MIEKRRKRSSIEMIDTALKYLSEYPHKKTALSYRIGTNFNVVNNLLDQLLLFEMIEQRGSFYVITEKGEKFLEKSKELEVLTRYINRNEK